MARRKKSAEAAAPAPAEIRITGREWVMRPIDSVVPYARNAKVHGGEQIAKLRASLREFGFVRPLLIDEAGNLLAGHGTLEAARAEGMAEVPCVVASGLTDAQRRAYILADNRLAELAPWDNDTLSLELGELEGDGFDLEVSGFNLEDLDTEMDELAEKPESTTRSEKVVTCPSCGCEFHPTKRRKK